LLPLITRPEPDTRAPNPATIHSGQSAATIESFAVESVVNDPVIPMTGEMTYTHPIVRVPGIGLDFAFVLSYRSGFGYDGPVGEHWEHNWNARVKVDTANDNLTRYASNRADVYTTSGGGTSYTSPSGQFEKSTTRLTTPNPDEVHRRLQDGTLEVYAELDTTKWPGWFFLTKVEHRDSDNAITLAYDQYERLETITDTRGKQFKLGYGSDNRVTSLADWSSGGGSADRTWTLGYEGTNGVVVLTENSALSEGVSTVN
jgi:YD repeat-containing protein